MEKYDGKDPINLGSGTEHSIAELAECVQQVVGFEGEIVYDASKPEGMPLKALDTTPLKTMGWKPQTEFVDALAITYTWFLENCL